MAGAETVLGVPRKVQDYNDPLSDSLHQLRLTGSLYCRAELTAPWGIDMPVFTGKMMFHVITSGSCWLQIGDSVPIHLRQGSLVLIPHGRGHVILSDPSSESDALFDIPVEKVSECYEIMQHGGGGVPTELTCGVVNFDQIAGQQLVNQLPEIILIDSWDAETDDWLHSTLKFISREAQTLKPGGQTVITHLADILVIQAIRFWLNTAPEAHQGWLGALRDAKIGTALTVLHREPEKNWTVGSLAQEVGMSRSGFSARFTELVGDSVKRYLTYWRMQIARDRLLQGSVPIAILAEQLGYSSEAAFSRAFKRTMGVSPSNIHRLSI